MPSSNNKEKSLLPTYCGLSIVSGIIDGGVLAGGIAAFTGQPFSIPVAATVTAFSAFVVFVALAFCNAAGD